MTDPSTDANLDPTGDGDDYVARPRWVKWFAGVSIALVIIYVLLLLASVGAGNHSSDRHQSLRSSVQGVEPGQPNAPGP